MTRVLKIDYLLFVLLVIICFVIQYSLLKNQLNYGFMPDDWWPLYDFYMLPSNFFDAARTLWQTNGIYTSYQVVYIGILEHFYQFDFLKYQLTNQLLKFLSVIFVFPLVLTLFKSRILAFVTTIIYAIHFSPVGTLEITAKGLDYLAIVFLEFFLIIYSKLLSKKVTNLKWILLSLVVMLSTLVLSPIRMYPLILVIILVEVFQYIIYKNKESRVNNLKRLGIFLSPFIIAFILSPQSFTKFIMINPPAIVDRISNGNWQLILHPFVSFGSTFFPGKGWEALGRNITIENIEKYINYLIYNPYFIFIPLLIIISWAVSKKFRLFFLITLFLNIFLDLVIFPLLYNFKFIEPSKRLHFDLGNIHALLGSLFVVSVAIMSFIEWFKFNRKNLLLPLWLGPLFSFTFILLTWILADFNTIPKGVHSYLTVPALGSSLFISTVIVALFKKIYSIKNNIGQVLAPMTFLLILPFYFGSSNDIKNYTDNFLNNGMNALEQQDMRNKIWQTLEGYDSGASNLVFIYSKSDYQNGRFYELSSLGRFDRWMYFWGTDNKDKCLTPRFVLEDKEVIKKMIDTKDGVKGFKTDNGCGATHFFTKDHFYALELKDRNAYNIKEKFLKDIKF